MFCAGELGPIGGRNVVHGFTASVALFARGRRRASITALTWITDRTAARRLSMDPIEEEAIRLVRGFAMDAPRKANSGHPGTAMALAPLAQVLYGRVMRHDPTDPAVARP